MSGKRDETKTGDARGETNMMIDYAPLENCKNLIETYGEICVQCNKCGRFSTFTRGEAELFVSYYDEVTNRWAIHRDSSINCGSKDKKWYSFTLRHKGYLQDLLPEHIWERERESVKVWIETFKY